MHEIELEINVNAASGAYSVASCLHESLAHSLVRY